MNMDEQEPLKRNALGDIDFGKRDFDWSEFHQSRHTYVFRYYDADLDFYKPFFELTSKSNERQKKAEQERDYYEKRLFESPEAPPYDHSILHHNWQLNFLVCFFKEVFEERAFIEGYQPSHKYYKVILPRPLYEKIMGFIKDFELVPISDLIFELISIGQDIYTEEIAHWERPEYQQLISTAEREAQKAAAVIHKTDDKSWVHDNKKKPSELLRIKFIFNDETITVQHRWLASEFVDYFKKEYDSFPLKSWKKELDKYARRFEDNKVKSHYKYKLAKSFYNLLAQGGFYKITPRAKTPNNVMLCVVRFLEFCLIPVGKPDELDEVKIKIVRNWISRKEFNPHPTSLDIPADTIRLKKYFAAEFIDLASDKKKIDALSIAAFIAERYDIEEKLPDLAHIAAALKQCGWMIGHQLINQTLKQSAFPEFESLSKLVNGVREKRKLKSLKFQLESDENDRELTSRLPLYLIEEALKDYSDDHQVEFDNDTLRTFITINENGALSARRDNKFNLPEERFIVRFVKSFYDYLLNEIPPDENDYLPSRSYYGIIANMLQQTWFFYHMRHPEWFIIEKVKQWHQLSLQGTNAS